MVYTAYNSQHTEHNASFVLDDQMRLDHTVMLRNQHN